MTDMNEEKRHAAYLEAQELARDWAVAAEDCDPGQARETAIRLANMWANVAQALRKDRV